MFLRCDPKARLATYSRIICLFIKAVEGGLRNSRLYFQFPTRRFMGLQRVKDNRGRCPVKPSSMEGWMFQLFQKWPIKCCIHQYFHTPSDLTMTHMISLDVTKIKKKTTENSLRWWGRERSELLCVCPSVFTAMLRQRYAVKQTEPNGESLFGRKKIKINS